MAVVKTTLGLTFVLLVLAGGPGCADTLDEAEKGGALDDAALAVGEAPSVSPPSPRGLVGLRPIGVYDGGMAGEGAAEISAFDPGSARLFVVNGATATIDVLDLSDPGAPALVDGFDVSPYGAPPTSVDVADGVVAVAVAASPVYEAGTVVLFSAADLGFINALRVGALPDMLTFSPDHTKLVVACEGEPGPDYLVDPEGSVAIIDVRGDLRALDEQDVSLARFTAFEAEDVDAGVRIYGPGSTVAQDLEPEYVAVSADSKTAWVSLQENNALAVVDLESATISKVVGLGFKDHGQPGMGMDLGAALEGPAGRGGGIARWPVSGMYQPDALAHFRVDGQDYVLSANEGAHRRYGGFDELTRVGDLSLDAQAFPDGAALLRERGFAQLPVSALMGDDDDDGDYERLFSFGTRSISVWSAAGELVWDSGDELERATAALARPSSEAVGDGVGEDSECGGPSPEGAVTAQLWGRPYAFVGLEHAGGVVAYDLSDPLHPQLVEFEHSTSELDERADIGPEGLEVILAEDSPSGEDLLLVANEISGTIRIYELLGD